MFCANDLTAKEICDKICEQRGINNPYEFFYPAGSWILDPLELKNMDKAIAKTMAHKDDNIGVFFDTDADGICSGTEVTEELRALGFKVQTFINSGKAHGLLQGDQLNTIKKSGIKLLINPDSLDSTTDSNK